MYNAKIYENGYKLMHQLQKILVETQNKYVIQNSEPIGFSLHISI